jgi:hypothetical protein
MQQDWDKDVEREDVISPVEWLSQETGINFRSIERTLRCETKFTVLENAEKLCLAVGRPDLIAPGGLLEVVANPMWNPERWANWYKERTCGE